MHVLVQLSDEGLYTSDPYSCTCEELVAIERREYTADRRSEYKKRKRIILTHGSINITKFIKKKINLEFHHILYNVYNDTKNKSQISSQN